jgi:hypothetical protein
MPAYMVFRVFRTEGQLRNLPGFTYLLTKSPAKRPFRLNTQGQTQDIEHVRPAPTGSPGTATLQPDIIRSLGHLGDRTIDMRGSDVLPHMVCARSGYRTCSPQHWVGRYASPPLLTKANVNSGPSIARITIRRCTGAELAASREQCANSLRDAAASEPPTRIAETARVHSVEIQNDNFPG